MRILIVAPYPGDKLRSIVLYSGWLKRMFELRGHTVDYKGPEQVFANLWKGGRIQKYLGYVDKYVLFPQKLRKLCRHYDFVIFPDQGDAIYARKLSGRPYFLTCHDVNAIRAARGEFAEVKIHWPGKIQQRWILSGLCAAEHVVCVSHHTAGELNRLGRKSVIKTSVIHNALNDSYLPGVPMSHELQEKFGKQEGKAFLLCLGGITWYKNRIAAIEIFARLIKRSEFADLCLVMAGRPLSRTMKNLIERERIESQVVEMVDVSSSDLQALYSNAAALIFPSLAEGFGWPVLEAQASGCPVITSNRAPMTEVAADAAIYIDPLDIEAAVTMIAQQWGRLKELRQLGFENLKRFDSAKIEQQYLDLCESILQKYRLKG